MTTIALKMAKKPGFDEDWLRQYKGDRKKAKEEWKKAQTRIRQRKLRAKDKGSTDYDRSVHKLATGRKKKAAVFGVTVSTNEIVTLKTKDKQDEEKDLKIAVYLEEIERRDELIEF